MWFMQGFDVLTYRGLFFYLYITAGNCGIESLCRTNSRPFPWNNHGIRSRPGISNGSCQGLYIQLSVKPLKAGRSPHNIEHLPASKPPGKPCLPPQVVLDILEIKKKKKKKNVVVGDNVWMRWMK